MLLTGQWDEFYFVHLITSATFSRGFYFRSGFRFSVFYTIYAVREEKRHNRRKMAMQFRKFDIEAYRQTMRKFIGADPETKVFWDALNFALEAHGDQWRRSGDPYIMHPCNVARSLAEELDIHNPGILAAALLHDTSEDVEYVAPAVIRDNFGQHVEAIVEGCTKVTHYTGDRQTFQKLVHRKIFSGAAAKPEVMLVKLADRLHNLRTLSSMPRHKRQKIADETLNINAPLATILGLFAIKREMYNLALAYKFPKKGNKLQLKIDKLKKNEKVREIVQQLQQTLQEDSVASEVTVRTKGLWGYYDAKNRILIKEIDSRSERRGKNNAAPPYFRTSRTGPRQNSRVWRLSGKILTPAGVCTATCAV